MLRDLLSASRAARLLRIDEFREESHPRDQGGRFAAEASAKEASEHAVRARAVASGTTPSARSSARKAEEHSHLAAIAARAGSAGDAAHHASEARRHADVAVVKVAASGLARVEAPPKIETPPPPPPPPKISEFHPATGFPMAHLREAERQLKAHGHLGYLHQSTAPSPVAGSLDTVHRGLIPSTSPAGVRLTDEAQRDIRSGMNHLMSGLGLHDRDRANAESHRTGASSALGRGEIDTAARFVGPGTPAAQAMEVVVRSSAELGGALGVHDWSGRIELSPEIARHFAEATRRGMSAVGAEHSRTKTDSILGETPHQRLLARQALLTTETQIHAFKTVAHEAAHGHGPRVEYRGHGAAVEELTTELVAKHVTRVQCGFTMHTGAHLYATGYTSLIEGAVSRVSKITGASPSDDLRREMEHAAIRFKRGSGHVTRDQAVRDYVRHLDLDAIAGRPLGDHVRGQMRDELVGSLSGLSVAEDQATLKGG